MKYHASNAATASGNSTVQAITRIPNHNLPAICFMDCVLSVDNAKRTEDVCEVVPVV